METIINKTEVLELMKKKKISSQNQLAQMIGVSPTQLTLMFTKNYNQLHKNIIKIAEILEADVSEILIEQTKKEFNRFDYKYVNYEDVKGVEPKKKFTVLETFAGAGGLALGLENAGLISIGAIEIDKNAVETLRRNKPEWNIIEDDIESIANNDLYRLVKVKNIDVLSGGFPCQSFSYAGKRQGLEDTRGTLFYPYSKILKKTKPKIFLAENVKGLINNDYGRTLETMITIFQDNGYTIYWNVFNAWDYEVAQKRERIMIIGIRNDLIEKQNYNFAFPLAQQYKPVLRDVLMDVPPSPLINYSENKRKILELVPPGGSWVDLPEKIARDYLGASWYSGGGKRGMARRLSWDEPSLTLTTSPSQKQTERCHPDETRPFTVREYARIQSFPDEWNFAGTVLSQYKQIGNAVPVKLAEYIGKSIIKYLNQFED